MTYEVALYTIGAAVLAGIAWNTLGIWQKWRNAADDYAVDWKRVRKNVIIGAILGLIAYGVGLQAGEINSGAVIVTIQSFVLAVIGFFPLVVVADKIFNKTRE